MPRKPVPLLALILTIVLLLPAFPTAGQGSEPVQDPDTGVLAWPELDGMPANHVDGEVTYPMVPPAGGPHNPVWQDCGVYLEPIYNWHAVHSLEHGAVWITYDPSLPAADVVQLQALANQGHIIVSPYPGLTDPVVASAWGRQVRLDGAADPRLQQFIVEFRRNPNTAPEPNATCSMGTTATMPAGQLPQQPQAADTPATGGDIRDEYKEKN